MPEEARMRIRRIVFRRARRLLCMSGSYTILCECCTCTLLTRMFLCLLRNTISRSCTEMFLAIFQHARPEDSFAKSTSLLVQVRPIRNLVRFRCSCGCKKLMQTFLCLLRDTISRSFYGDVPRHVSEHGARERRSDLQAPTPPESSSRKATALAHAMYSTSTSCHFCRDFQQKRN